jgi:hypothetical protein
MAQPILRCMRTGSARFSSTTPSSPLDSFANRLVHCASNALCDRLSEGGLPVAENSSSSDDQTPSNCLNLAKLEGAAMTDGVDTA